MNILVIGHRKHGKDEVCLYLKEKHNIDYWGSSWFSCVHFIFNALKDKYGYSTPEQCYEDRDDKRREWFLLIREFNKKDETKLARSIFDEAPVYCGMRSIEEFTAGCNANLFDLIIWVDASERVGVLESKGSMELNKYMADVIIDNNGTKESLYRKLDKLAYSLKTVLR